MQVVMDFHIGLDQELDLAREIVREAALSSRYVFLAKPVVVLVTQSVGPHMVSVRLRLKSYVLDAKYEKIFETDVNLRVLRSFREAGIRARIASIAMSPLMRTAASACATTGTCRRHRFA
jgi:small-conductance mechanosensitive channel